MPFIVRLICILATVQSAVTKVFVVPHSHNDAGWLVDVQQSYSKYCRFTLDNIFMILEKVPSFKFCWSEMIFLSMWLEENPSQKEKLKEYIKAGRFEIVGGGWVQNDEALPDFELVIRQMETGFDYLKQELGVNKVKIGWQLDPFGHSSLTASLWEKMGFDVMVVARIDEFLKDKLEKAGDLEFIWKGEGLGAKKGIFTHVLNQHYSFPEFIRYSSYYVGNIQRCYLSWPPSDKDVEKW